ncbi:MAG: hypothetical protein QM520_06475, partial [Gammaproteobacteria bacterium]|nr:hypothetical protein [Gammaproteobacteria bacterium]
PPTGSSHPPPLDPQMVQGATLAASALYQKNQMGTVTTLTNAWGFGIGYESPLQYQDKLLELASKQTPVADTLRQIQQDNKPPSEASLKYLDQQLKLAHP